MSHGVSPHLTRMLLEAGRRSGVDGSRLTGIPGLTVVGEEHVRIPTTTLLHVWETISGAMAEAGGGARAMELWRPGRLGVWDYLFPAADTLHDALHASGRHFATIADPADTLRVTRDGEGVTVTWHGPYQEQPSFPLIAEFVPAMLLGVAGSGAGRRLVPVRVRLPHRPPPRHDLLADVYGTRRIEFEAGPPAVTFSEADADAPFPGADPALAAILDDHARITVATARPVLDWLGRFHLALEDAVGAGTPELADVARRLAMGPRTLQRRLRDEGTSWRDELERFRRQRVEHLLRETSMTLEAISARSGYSDPRALRRAVHRWYGRGPAALRTAARADRAGRT
ncbi:helix-turn-helix domain-containing protein [Actinomadura algeriensis]|uniref:AraC-like DNA-binding protein n=1 Tax=Actinomadura algeriensis TaxID=1679523 RepID=A0ABR9JS08_9ACTN|nr:AraC family transcriptional regulator [Actinomadura algeriensis]MBE1533178.1 AraC-like DNA-binding protein [Actinomadura algeriensis]